MVQYASLLAPYARAVALIIASYGLDGRNAVVSNWRNHAIHCPIYARLQISQFKFGLLKIMLVF
jgi:hypothetical protein